MGHSSEAREVACRRIWISLERFLVLLDHLKRGGGCPPEERTDLKILVRVHFYVVDLRIPHPWERMPGSRWGPMPRRMDIRKVHAPLLPPCSYHIGTDEGQKAVAARIARGDDSDPEDQQLGGFRRFRAPAGLVLANECPLWVISGHWSADQDVRFSSEGRHSPRQFPCPLSAIRRHLPQSGAQP